MTAMDFGNRVNLHTHSRLCGHGTGNLNEYCSAALHNGFRILGFSEHNPFPDHRYSDSRMDFSQLEFYCSEVRKMRRDFPQLAIPLGLEVDYLASLGKAFYEDIYLNQFRVDYMICGVHFVEPDLAEYDLWDRPGKLISNRGVQIHAESVIRAISSGLFAYIAHPDIFTRCRLAWDAELTAATRDIIAAAQACQVPLEINAYGMRKPPLEFPDGTTRRQYPMREFWDLIAESNDVPVVCGMDAHRPVDVWSNGEEVLQFAAERNLQLQNLAVAEKILKHHTPEVSIAEKSGVTL